MELHVKMQGSGVCARGSGEGRGNGKKEVEVKEKGGRGVDWLYERKHTSFRCLILQVQKSYFVLCYFLM